MDTLTPTQIGEKLSKTAKEINEFLSEINFIKKCNSGWELTDLGKKNGGIQNNYKGNLSVYWKIEILNNKIFKNAVEPQEVKDKDETDFRNKFKAEYRTNDGHYVRSRAEVIISNWLFSECIAHAYEKRVPIEEDVYCDFYIPKGKIYIEFWGYEDDEKYLARKQKKRELYKKYNLNLIEIDNSKINNIDDFLPRELLKFGINLS
ncbi:MAG: hypothetical protein ACTTJF_02640 [Campylobacter sp.]|uniref:hypothetical protein n=1 Tax=Campylobacter sp. TaxID=205 RepID=UPI003FA14363